MNTKRVESSTNKSTVLAGVVLLAVALPGGYAIAQGGDGIPTPPGAVRMGPLSVYPSVTYELQRNDNVLLQDEGSGNVKSDTLQVLKPELRAEAVSGPHTFGAGLGFQAGRYNNLSSDDFNTNNVFLGADLNPDTRINLRLRAEHLDAIDPRGSTTDPLTPTPNRYRQTTLGGIFGFGAPKAKGRFELEVGGLAKRYYNNEASGVQGNNRDDTLMGGTFFWRVAPKTSVLAQVKRTDIDFIDDATRLDSNDMKYYLGVTWEATAKTTGIFKLGTVRKDFNDSARSDVSTPSWDAQIKWEPLSYSTWDFIVSRAYRETTVNVGDTVLASSNTAVWNHKWNSRVSTKAIGSYAIDEYKGLARKDKLPTLGLKATYQMRRWLGIGADYTWTRRDSDVGGADYKKNVLMFFINATL
ncbi:MAG: hypothetical protein A3H32_14710 [Betaproteobacteria bacterium RIFCSPLOWO2_02_FULL_63_19]|nr:MAG: hypothetical protein A3H32_14710 [Betaproteobacteria bacterium RIFCSPLOWO2_02_FULL_63_19]